MTATLSKISLDLRRIPPHERHALIFSTFGKLPSGEALEIVNDHDPRPLRDQFQFKLPGQFAWQYQESGPDTWRVVITKQADSPSHTSGACCGACGGA